MGRHGVFGPQTGALHHSETVLLVDDYKTEIAELHAVFDEGMGAYGDVERAVEKL